MRALFIGSLLTLAALAGCIGGGDDHDHDHDADHGPDHNGDHAQDGGHGHDGGHDPDDDPHGAPDNGSAGPAVAFTVDVLTGTAPLTVNFTWTATGFDAHNTSWALDLDGSGDEDAAGEGTDGAFTHTYEAAGTWNATLTLADGGHARSKTLTIAVEEAAAGPAVVAHYEAEAAYVTGIGSGDPEWALQCPGFVAGQNGQGCVFFAFEEDLSGLAYTMTATVASLRWAFWSACSPSADGIAGGSAADDTHEGEVPEGAGCVIIWSAATSSEQAPLGYTFTVFPS